MQIRTLLFTACLAMLMFNRAEAQPLPGAQSFAFIRRQFENPDKAFGSAPLWVWNARVTREMIDSMLTGFKQQSFGGVFVHPRPGLITPYLSEEWFDLWKYAMQKAKQLGLDIWIYDENSYPSGFAGGHVPAEMPSSFNQAQMLQMQKTQELPAPDQYFFALQKTAGGHFRKLSAGSAGVAGEPYLVFKKVFYQRSPWYGGFSYVDLMAPGVTEKFIELTMRKGYEPVIGNEFGKTVRGIFSDEPNIESGNNKSIRWTPLLFQSFRKKWGYSLEENLPSLFKETGDWKKVRHNYYSVLLDLFIEHWSKPMSRYASEKKLEWTGHYWEHEWPSLAHGPDNMAMYAWHQRPGIDMLFNQFNEYSCNAQFGNIRSVKELSSVANQLGKKRTLSETYGGGGWELSFKDMKRLGDWEFVLGINTLNQHLAYMSMEGARKYDYPQSFSYHNPWWPYYGGLNKHFARLSLALSTGRQKNDILVLEPTTTSWMYYRYTDSNQIKYHTGQAFQSFITRLEKAQVEYDLGSEDIIQRNGKIKAGRFIVGEAEYKTIVIPPGTENLNSSSCKLLKQFAAQGGKILAFDTVQYIDGSKDPRLAAFMRTVMLFDSSALNEALIAKHLSSSAIHFGPIDTSTMKLYHQRRELEDGRLLFLINSAIDQPAHGTVWIAGQSATLLNTQTGAVTDLAFKKSGKGISLDYSLPAAGSMLIFVSRDSKLMRAAPDSASPGGQLTVIPASETAVNRMRPNILNLDFCDLRLSDTLLKNQYFFLAADYLFKKNGFKDGDPWNTSVQFKDETIRRDTFGTHSGFEASYHFTLDAPDASAMQLKAVVERAGIWEVWINSVRLEALKNEWWLDKDFSVFSIGNAVKTGINTLTLKAPRMSIFAELQPVYILGNFNLRPDTVAFKIAPAKTLTIGSWKEQQLPFYGHDMSYTKTFTIDNPKKKYFINAGKWKGTVAQLNINGRQVSILTGNETNIDITQYVQAGKNTAELIVTGSLKNTLGPFYNKPAPGLVSPWHWRYVDKQVPASAYDLLDYGLMEDFTIERFE